MKSTNATTTTATTTTTTTTTTMNRVTCKTLLALAVKKLPQLGEIMSKGAFLNYLLQITIVSAKYQLPISIAKKCHLAL